MWRNFKTEKEGDWKRGATVCLAGGEQQQQLLPSDWPFENAAPLIHMQTIWRIRMERRERHLSAGAEPLPLSADGQMEDSGRESADSPCRHMDHGAVRSEGGAEVTTEKD